MPGLAIVSSEPLPPLAIASSEPLPAPPKADPAEDWTKAAFWKPSDKPPEKQGFFRSMYDGGIAPVAGMVIDTFDRGDLGEGAAKQVLGSFKDQLSNFQQHPDIRNLPIVGAGATATANRMQQQYNAGNYKGMLGTAFGFLVPFVTPEAVARVSDNMPAISQAAAAAADATGNFAKAAGKATAAGAKAAAPDLAVAALKGAAAPLVRNIPGGGVATGLGELAALRQAGTGVLKGAKAAGEAWTAERAAQAAARAPEVPAVIRESPVWADIQPSPAAASDFSPIPAEGLPSGRVPGSLARAEAARAAEAEAAAAPEVNRDVIDERPDARTVTTEPAAALPEPWRIPKSEIVDYRDTRPQRTATAAPETGGYTEAEMHARTLENRANEDTPPTFNRYPVGTYAKDSDGELLQLRRYALDDPKLIFPEGMPHPGNQTVQKYVDWIGQGSEPPPLTGIETEAGNIKIQEGHHRAQAIQQTGGNAADVWVNLTHNRPLGNGQVMGEGVTHEGAVRRALDAGETVPAAVLNDYPQLMAKANPAQISAEPAAAEPASDLEQQLRASIDLANARRAGTSETPVTPVTPVTPALTPAQILEDRIDEHAAYLANQAEDIHLANRARKADRLAQHMIENNMEPTPENVHLANRQLAEPRKPSADTVADTQQRVEWHNARQAQAVKSESGQTAQTGHLESDIPVSGPGPGIEMESRGTGGGPAAAPPDTTGAGTSGQRTAVDIPGEQRTYPATYTVKELGDIQPSHHGATFEPNPEYGYKNDRLYDDPRNQRKIVDWSTKQGFNPRNLLNTAPTSELGPPVVDAAGNVLGGNGRSMILQRVYAGNPEGAAAYRAELDRTASHYGVDPASYAEMKQPVLVRELDPEILNDKDAAARAITDFNKTGTAALTPSERAIADARGVSQRTLDDIAAKMDRLGPDATLAQTVEGRQGIEVLRNLERDGVISPQEGAELATETKLTRQGKERVSGLMLGRFFQDAKQMDALPDSLRNKLERMAAPLARADTAGYSLQPVIRSALDLLEDAEAHGAATVDDYIRQQGLFGDREYSPEAIGFAKALKSTNPVELTHAARRYAERAKYAQEYQGAGMFGNIPPPLAPAEAFHDSFEHLTK